MSNPLLLTLFFLSAISIQSFTPKFHNTGNTRRQPFPNTDHPFHRQNIFHHRFTLHLPTQLSLSSSASSDLPDASSMRAKDLRAELRSYGISTESFFEKSEMVEAVEKARKKGKTAKVETESSDSSSSTSSSKGGSRADRLAEAMKQCNSMKVSELKSELASYGISTKSFFEKSEFVRACAEARVDGVASKKGGGRGVGTKEENYDPSYRDVVMQKMSKQSKDQMMRDQSRWGFNERSNGQSGFIDVTLG